MQEAIKFFITGYIGNFQACSEDHTIYAQADNLKDLKLLINSALAAQYKKGSVPQYLLLFQNK